MLRFRRGRPRRLALLPCALAASVLLNGSPARAQSAVWSRWAFEGRRYYDPTIAEPRAAQVNALALAMMREVPFLQEGGSTRRAWDIDVGAELPIFGIERGASTGGRMARGAWGAGLWFAVDFHLLEDMVDPSAPILNTDYRFSGIGKFQYGLSATSWLGVRLQGGHESTHLGDEYSLAANRLFPEFERINVSYEYIDAGLSYERQTIAGRTSSVRAGVITTIPFADTYYTADTLETGGRQVTESVNALEPYVQLQHRRDRFCSGPGTEGRWCRRWGGYASLDARLKTVYDYHKPDPAAAEDRQPSFNVIVGIAHPQGSGSAFGNASPYLRAYTGVNTHGQFRNERNWWIYGIGVRLDR